MHSPHSTEPHCAYCGSGASPLEMQEMQRTLAARDKMIAMLSRRMQSAAPVAARSGTAAGAVELEKIVARKTAELERERFELEKALSELRSTQVRLLQAHKLESIGQLAAGVAHEINTPAQYVADNVQFLQRGTGVLLGVLDAALDAILALRAEASPAVSLQQFDAVLAAARLEYLREQIPLALEQSRDGLTHVTSIVSAMKQFSHPSTGEKEEVNLVELVETALIVSRGEWKYIAELRTEFAPDLPLVPCLRQELSQVVINLVVNAAHAIKEHGTSVQDQKGLIVVRLRREGDKLEMRVEDNGTGIPEAIRGRVFDPFFTTKPVGQGTGQGLAIVYATVVGKHGGRIALESTIGAGTTFIVQLPLTDTHSASDAT